MRIPESFIETVKQNTPLAELIGSLVPVTLKPAGDEKKCLCPFHQETHESFSINNKRGFYYCFGCGATGDALDFVMQRLEPNFREAVKYLAERAGLKFPSVNVEAEREYETESRLLALHKDAASFYYDALRSKQSEVALQYLLEVRGLTRETLDKYKIGFAPGKTRDFEEYLLDNGHSLEDMKLAGLVKESKTSERHYYFFRDRIMFPITDTSGRTVAFGGRVRNDKVELRYMNSWDHPLFKKSKLLYGLTHARPHTVHGRPFVVVEGYMDVLSLSQAGFQGAVAVLGSNLSEQHLRLIWKYGLNPNRDETGEDSTPIICFDGDAAGKRALSHALNTALPHLSTRNTFRSIVLPEEKDPDDIVKAPEGRDAFEQLLGSSKPYVDALWEDLKSRNGRLQTPEGKLALKHALQEKLQLIQDAELRELYLDEYEGRVADLGKRQTGKRKAAAPDRAEPG